jgi:hypothetical protein
MDECNHEGDFDEVSNDRGKSRIGIDAESSAHFCNNDYRTCISSSSRNSTTYPAPFVGARRGSDVWQRRLCSKYSFDWYMAACTCDFQRRITMEREREYDYYVSLPYKVVLHPSPEGGFAV